ncbi:MAG: DUF6163 family protein [Nitratireductor sp.]
MALQPKPQSKAFPFFYLIGSLFYRLISLVLIYIAIVYWMGILGISHEGERRFDLIALHWQYATTILCVLLPIAALGLWGGFSWGVAIWLICAITELVMYQALPHLFGQHPNIVFFHLFCMVVFVSLISIATFIENKK